MLTKVSHRYRLFLTISNCIIVDENSGERLCMRRLYKALPAFIGMLLYLLMNYSILKPKMSLLLIYLGFCVIYPIFMPVQLKSK